MIRHPAYGKQHSKDKQHPGNSPSSRHHFLRLLLAHFRVPSVQDFALSPQTLADHGVGNCHETSGQHEHKHKEENGIASPVVDVIPHFMAEVERLRRDDVKGVDVPDEDEWHHDAQGYDPNGHQDLESVFAIAECPEGHRVADGKVAVQTENSDGEHTGGDRHA